MCVCRQSCANSVVSDDRLSCATSVVSDERLSCVLQVCLCFYKARGSVCRRSCATSRSRGRAARTRRLLCVGMWRGVRVIDKGDREVIAYHLSSNAFLNRESVE